MPIRQIQGGVDSNNLQLNRVQSSEASSCEKKKKNSTLIS